MPQFLEELRIERKLLAARLAKLRETIGSQDTADQLVALKEPLLSHLRKSDRVVYMPLQESAAAQQEHGWLMEGYTARARRAVEVAVQFFDQYGTGKRNTEGWECAKDFGSLCAMVLGRMQVEESFMEPTLERMGL